MMAFSRLVRYQILESPDWPRLAEGVYLPPGHDHGLEVCFRVVGPYGEDSLNADVDLVTSSMREIDGWKPLLRQDDVSTEMAVIGYVTTVREPWAEQECAPYRAIVSFPGGTGSMEVDLDEI